MFRSTNSVNTIPSANFSIYRAMLRYYASAVYAVVMCLSVCLSDRLSVRLSVTRRYCVKRLITQTTPHNSTGTPVFWCHRSWRNCNGVTPNGGVKCRWV